MTQAYTHNFTEVHELAGATSPQTLTVGTHTYGYYDMANHQRAFLLLLVGDMAQGSTFDCQIWQSTDNAGAATKVVVGKAITQLSAALGDGDDVVGIELRTEELDVDGGFSFISVVVTVAGGNVVFAAAGFGGASNYVPVSTANWTEIVL